MTTLTAIHDIATARNVLVSPTCSSDLLQGIDKALKCAYVDSVSGSTFLDLTHQPPHAKQDRLSKRKEAAFSQNVSAKVPKKLVAGPGVASEQLWQQIELWNLSALRLGAEYASTCLSLCLGTGDSGSSIKKRAQPSSKQQPAQNGGFFNLDDMNKFDDMHGEDIDFDEASLLYGGSDNEEERSRFDSARSAMYDDFFDPTITDGSNVNGTAATKSAVSKLNKQMGEEAEEMLLAPKPWQLTGEVAAAKRPKNSALEEFVEFSSATRPAPVVTEEFSNSIEAIVLRRIKDKAWDDVERRIKPVVDQKELRRQAMAVDSEKSKLSLAEVYERDYIVSQPGGDAAVGSKTENAAHSNIKEDLRNLFFQLDVLSNFHFTPSQASAEFKVISQGPAASFEEALPVAVSTIDQLAPEEVRRGLSGTMKSKEEQSSADHNRVHRRAKRHMKARKSTEREKLEKRAAGGDTRAEKLLALEKLKSTKSSRVTFVDSGKGSDKKGRQKLNQSANSDD